MGCTCDSAMIIFLCREGIAHSDTATQITSCDVVTGLNTDGRQDDKIADFGLWLLLLSLRKRTEQAMSLKL